MSTSTRVTVASLSARIDTMEALADERHAQIIALLTPEAPAKVTKPVTRKPRTAAKKTPAKKAKPAPKGAQTRETLSRKDWNRTLTTLAKTQPKGSGTYAAVLAAWSEVSVWRDQGMTPAEVLACFVK